MLYLKDKLSTQITIADFYSTICIRLCGTKRPRLLHDNARCHVANNVTLLLRQWQILEHPPYSPDMNPYDFLFSICFRS
ncbi:hypothetical protein X975_25625, partial [Stegodyphus mimosarum]